MDYSGVSSIAMRADAKEFMGYRSDMETSPLLGVQWANATLGDIQANLGGNVRQENSTFGNNRSGMPDPSAELALSVAEAIPFSIMMSLCICATVVGNVLVIMSVFTYRPLKGVQNFFIVSLAVADLAVALLVMPFNIVNFVIGRWVFGAIFCNIWLTFDILTCTASILNLCAIAIDRYYAIHDPIRYAQKRTFKRVLISIFIVWAASALISIPPLIGWNNSGGNSLYDDKTQVCTLTSEKGFVIYSASGSFYIPLIIMTFVYVNIFRALRRRLRARAKAAQAAKKAANNANKTSKSSPVLSYNKGANTPNQEVPAADVSSTESPEETHEPGADGDNLPHSPPHSNPDSPCHVGAHKYTASSNLDIPKKKLKPMSSNASECSHLTSADSDKRENCDNGSAKTNSGKKHGKKKKLTAPKSQVHLFLEERQRISLSKERRAARTMAIIMGAFVACWLPFFLMYVIFPFCAQCAEATDDRVENFIVWLGYINSTLNPIIYTIFNIDFRRAFKNLLLGKCKI